MDHVIDQALELLLTGSPYKLPPGEKKTLLLEALQESYRHHFRHCAGYRRFCERRGYQEESIFSSFTDFPFLPVQAFKESAEFLSSVDAGQIRTTLHSSATSGIPSTIVIDKITSKRQIRALAAVITEVLGPKRRTFLVMDVDPRLTRGPALGARGAAVQGFLNLAREARYFMAAERGDQLVLQKEILSSALAQFSGGAEPVVIFGFTYVLFHDVAGPLIDAGEKFLLPPGSQVVHIGGWKKLEDRKVDKRTFNETMSRAFGVPPAAVVDFYGFTEQMGVLYPDGPEGLKHAPAFAEVVVRDPSSFKALPDGDEGLLQFLTPIPYSYPGFSVLTDDLGVILNRERAENGWEGTQFKILGRAAKSEVRGCGDIMSEKILQPKARPAANSMGAAPPTIRLLFDGEGLYCPRRLAASIRVEDLPEIKDLPAFMARLVEARRRLDSYSVDELIALVDAAALRWMDLDSPLFSLRQQGLFFLSTWCKAQNLQSMADRSLHGARGHLDGFRPLGGTNLQLMRAVPRGFVGHWLAGNVPLLGMLTLAQSIIARNANILKTADTFSSVLPLLLDSFRGLRVQTMAGRNLEGDDVLASMAVVYFPHQNIKAAQDISAAVDVRLAWGGREAVEAIVHLPKRYDAEDIIFGPKLSYMAIGKEYLSTPRLVGKMCRRAATDVSVFDQYACASPHTIFVETHGLAASPKEFAAALAEEMARTAVRIPKAPVDAATSAQVERRRMRYEFSADLWTSAGTEWTVLFDEEGASGLAEPCYSRVITVRAIDDILKAAAFAHSGIQTIGLALDGARKLAFAEIASALGAERFPEVGRMTFFDTPWDGLFALDRMVRWVTLGGPY